MKKSRTRDVTYCSQIDKKGTENWCIELIPRSKYCKNYLRPKTNDTFLRNCHIVSNATVLVNFIAILKKQQLNFRKK